MSSTCFEHILPPTRLLIPLHKNKLYHSCTYNRLPEDEPSGSKHVEDIVKIKILVQLRCILLGYVIRLCYNAGAKNDARSSERPINNVGLYIFPRISES